MAILHLYYNKSVINLYIKKTTINVNNLTHVTCNWKLLIITSINTLILIDNIILKMLKLKIYSNQLENLSKN
jgi:hypothetical protein